MGINVLSLFDGMSCGQIALERAGIKIDNYYASEIDKDAIKVAQHNYPKTIQIGDVCNITRQTLPHIDMIIGGSPCQDFSLAKQGKGLEGDKSKLFFEYDRLVHEIQPKFWLLENVKMKQEYRDIIYNRLGTEGIEINSNLVSAQNRKRMYWTNIPYKYPPLDRKIHLHDIIDTEDREWLPMLPWTQKIWGNKKKEDTIKKITSEKSNCITTNKTHSRNYYKDERNRLTKLTAAEAEILQTLPQGYTDKVSEGKRFKMIGNGWTVDVIAHIFSFLPEEYKR